ncbi:MAG: PDC sensor domain-containing protein [Chromatiales bacterium]|nr:PDC sensor domain-containing protein [Chromatiales bacterium]
METALKAKISEQRLELRLQLALSMSVLATRCAVVLADRIQLDLTLANGLALLPDPQLAYVVDPGGRQISGNVEPDGIDPDVVGQDLSDRPYLRESAGCQTLSLSEVYFSRVTRRACITAIQPVVRDGRVVACLCADFDLHALPSTERMPVERPQWRQIKGDPAIRKNLFQQERVYSAMDARIDDVSALVSQLIREHGVFHAKLHYSSSRATLWQIDDPFCYRLHVLDEILAPDVCLAYPRRPYHERAIVPPDTVAQVFDRMRDLREADSTIYLRSASLNVINGLVGLNFSCDGSHYMPAAEFLAKPPEFWFGCTLK